MSFLSNISIYNPRADVAISTASASNANLWTNLKNTANDETLEDAIRERALTALITSAKLLEIAVVPYYPTSITPVTTTPTDTLHNQLNGIQGGNVAGDDVLHNTTAQQALWTNKAGLSDITFENLLGAVSANAALVAAFAAKQTLLSGNGLVRLAGSTLTYDNSAYLTSISGILAGGDLAGTYPNPTILNSAVIAKVLTGLPDTIGPILATDSILVAFGKTKGDIDALYVLAGNAITDLTGDVVATGPGSVATTISNNAVSFSKFQQVAQGFFGRSSVGTGSGSLLTPTQATALLNTFTSLLQGLVPASGGGTSNFLRADGTWAAPPSSGSGSVTNVSGAGIASLFALSITNPTTTPALAFALVTQSANLVFAGPASGSAAAPTWRALVSDDIPALAISKITNLQATLDTKLNASLTQGYIWIGNLSAAPVARVLMGDVTVSYLGLTLIGDRKVTYAKIQDITSGVLLGRYSATDGPMQQITIGSNLTLDPITGVLDASGGGGGTVTTVSVVSANGFAGTVATATTTPAITLTTTVTGLLKGNGTAISAATGGTDYVVPGVITGSGLTMATARILGRTTASTGAIEEISVGAGLTLSAGSLVATAVATGNQSFTSQTSITVTHNRGWYPVVQVIDGSGILLSPLSVTHASVNSFTVVLSTATTGNIIYA